MQFSGYSNHNVCGGRRLTEVFFGALSDENQTQTAAKRLYTSLPGKFSSKIFQQKLALNISSRTFALPNGT
jgi:hypothetical protein